MSTPGWSPPGPVAQQFLEAQDPIAVLMGPFASGKTTVGLMKGVMTAYTWPETAPGLRRVKFGVIRRLYKDLEKTTMASWNRWFPRNIGNWRGAAGDPATHDLVLRHPAGGRVELRVEFIALGDLRVEEALKGYEPSYCYVDEVDTAAPNTLDFLFGRAGRYPSETIRINPRMAWGTCNAPPEDNWVVTDFIDEPKPGHILYRQPRDFGGRREPDILGRLLPRASPTCRNSNGPLCREHPRPEPRRRSGL